MFVYVYDAIILINAVFIGLDEENPMVSNAEWGFLALYMLEIILKLYATEPRLFFARHQFWNWYVDYFCVLQYVCGCSCVVIFGVYSILSDNIICASLHAYHAIFPRRFDTIIVVSALLGTIINSALKHGK